MREVILSYWNSFFADFIRPYRDDITAISTLIVAIFTVVLARVAWKQTRDCVYRKPKPAHKDEGFAWNGKTYDSLSKVAFAITGTNWNGPRFFGLRDKISVETKS